MERTILSRYSNNNRIKKIKKSKLELSSLSRKKNGIKSLYLGGPIDMVSDADQSWKGFIVESLPDIVCFDPQTSYNNAKTGDSYFIQSVNTNALINSDAVILNLSAEKQTIGTIFELITLAKLPTFSVSNAPFFHEKTGQHVFIIIKSLDNIPVYLKPYRNYLTDSLDFVIDKIKYVNEEISHNRITMEFAYKYIKPIKVGCYIDIKTDNITPMFKAHENDVGYDLAIIEELILAPGESKDFHTGIWLDMPKSVWARITHRSSTFRKLGLLVLEGTIDPGFRGELMTCIYNITKEEIRVPIGSRLAQVIFMPALPIELYRVSSLDKLSSSDRGFNCFGSSGK